MLERGPRRRTHFIERGGQSTRANKKYKFTAGRTQILAVTVVRFPSRKYQYICHKIDKQTVIPIANSRPVRSMFQHEETVFFFF